jgi:hypothetical protein
VKMRENGGRNDVKCRGLDVVDPTREIVGNFMHPPVIRNSIGEGDTSRGCLPEQI